MVNVIYGKAVNANQYFMHFKKQIGHQLKARFPIGPYFSFAIQYTTACRYALCGKRRFKNKIMGVMTQYLFKVARIPGGNPVLGKFISKMLFNHNIDFNSASKIIFAFMLL